MVLLGAFIRGHCFHSRAEELLVALASRLD
jgi:hypothetical protein